MQTPPEPINENVIRRATKQLDNADLIKSSFWISQIFMIIATIVGVFLAAQEGLSQALLFDALNSKEKNYYLQHALADEITDNITTLNEYAEFITKGGAPHDLKPYHPPLDYFVWENMKFSSSSLETPSHILSAARRFNKKSTKLVKMIEARQYGRKFGANLITELTAEIQENGLKELIAHYTILHKELHDAGVEVNKL